MTTLLILAVAFLFAVGAPIAFGLSIATLLYFLAKGIPPIVLAQRMVYGIYSFPFLAIPFFLLAGRLLTQGGAYPERSLVITGQPRYDILQLLSERFTKQDILKPYGVSTDKKIVLWTTQSHGMPDAECLRNLDAVRGMMERERNFVIVIKQHPREGEEYAQMMKNTLGLPRHDIVLVPKNADTLLLIRACDLMITKFSTTAMEALALDKPLLLMNFSGEPDKIDYVEQGVARGVYEPQDLSAAVENLLNNKSDIAEKRREYIARCLYKIDGKATARIIEVIEEMLRERRK